MLVSFGALKFIESQTSVSVSSTKFSQVCRSTWLIGPVTLGLVGQITGFR